MRGPTKERTISILERAIEIMENGWTKDYLARDAKGRHVQIDSPRACSFCAVGAINRATKDVTNRYNRNMAYEICSKVRALGIPPREQGAQLTSFNDRQKRVGPVLTAFRRTIKHLKNL